MKYTLVVECHPDHPKLHVPFMLDGSESQEVADARFRDAWAVAKSKMQQAHETGVFEPPFVDRPVEEKTLFPSQAMRP